MIKSHRRFLCYATLTATLGTGCSVGLDDLTFDRNPDGGSAATTGTGGDTTTSGTGGGTTSGTGGGTGTTAGTGGGTTTSTGTGGGTTSTGTGGGTSTGTGGGSCTPIGNLSDELNVSSSLANWQVLSAVEQTPQLHDLLDINGTTPLQLSLRPNPSGMNGWFANNKGPFVYKEVTGNFLVAARVSAGQLANADQSPTKLFNVAGLLARDAMRPSPNWVLIDVGFQNPADAAIGNVGVGALAKSTLDGNTTRISEVGSHQGWLGICRVGSNFVMIGKLDGAASTVVIAEFMRPDLGPTLQVGMVVGTWTPNERDVVGRFDYMHFSTPMTAADCEACLLE